LLLINNVMTMMESCSMMRTWTPGQWPMTATTMATLSQVSLGLAGSQASRRLS